MPVVRDPARRLIRRLHRWLGLSAAIFVVLLSLTGIALNHSDGLSLNSRYLSSSWLQRWYGIDVPEPTISFSVGDQRLTLLGSRLYLDDAEVDSGIEAIVGAVTFDTALDQELVIATPRELIFVSQDGVTVDRTDLRSDLGAQISEIAAARSRVILRANDAIFAYDPTSQSALTLLDTASNYQWSRPSSVPVALLEQIKRQYGGSGISLERFVYDIHSGRILKSAGVWIMDFLAVAFILLAGTGVLVWFRR